MSVRAYKIIEYASVDTFNFWHDDFFRELFEEVIGHSNFGEDGTGSFEIAEEQLEEMKKLFEKRKKDWDKEEQERTLEIFEQIKKDFGNQNYANYIAF